MTEAAVVFLNAVFVSSFRFVLRPWPLPPPSSAGWRRQPSNSFTERRKTKRKVRPKKAHNVFQKRYAVRHSKKSEALHFFYVTEVNPVKWLRSNGHGFVYFWRFEPCKQYIHKSFRRGLHFTSVLLFFWLWSVHCLAALVFCSLLKIQGKKSRLNVASTRHFSFISFFEDSCEGRQELLTWQTVSSWSFSSPKDGTVQYVEFVL